MKETLVLSFLCIQVSVIEAIVVVRTLNNMKATMRENLYQVLCT